MSPKQSSFPFRHHALALALALATAPVTAATINVSGNCTLVNAINNANSDSNADGAGGCPAGSGADTLELEANAVYKLTVVDNDTGGANGLPLINSSITINGNGATIKRSSAQGTPEFRLLYIAATGNLTINKLKLTGGKGSFHYGSGPAYTFYAHQGGGIYNLGKLSLTDSTVSGNSVEIGGGGIFNGGEGSITLIESVISGNNARYGGGIYNGGEGSLTLTDSTISGNYAEWDGAGIFSQTNMTLTNSSVRDNNAQRYGGGIYSTANMTLLNSTVSGNAADLAVGGIFASAKRHVANSATLTNSTISNNTSPIRSYKAAGIFNSTNLTLTNSTVSGNTASIFSSYAVTERAAGILNWGTLTLKNSTVSNNSTGPFVTSGILNFNSMTLINSIIANNIGGANCDFSTYLTPSVYKYTILQGTNLIEDGSCGATLSGDPKLRALLDNGGPTLTHALKGDSPAIAVADPALCKTNDQRLVKRPSSCDLGAFERKALSPASVKPLVLFFDDQVASGGLSGTVAGQKADQHNALRNQLLSAGDYQDRGLKVKACDQMARALGYIDPDNTPEADDYVTGTGGGLLTDEINALRSDWSCS